MKSSNNTEWASRTLIRALQRGYLPKSLKEKLEKIFRPVMKSTKKKTEQAPPQE